MNTKLVTDQTFFQSIPWCAKLIADPNFAAIETPSRQPKKDREDSFFAETLHSPDTIDKCLTLYRKPTDETTVELKEIKMLLSLGHGLNGYPRIVHGGFIAMAIDEAISVLFSLNKDRRVARSQVPDRFGTLTAYLNITYKKPLYAPGLLLATVQVGAVEGRKRLMKSSIEDGQGTVYATAEALFVDFYGKL